MNAQGSDAPALLVKKFGGLVFLLFGLLLLGTGFSNQSTGLTLLGVAALAGGAVLLALKIRRRNQGDQL
jgi:LPXTG-motif cell wall-anchored protein